MNKLKIKLLTKTAVGMKMPAIVGDAGYDIYADQDCTIKAHGSFSVHTGYAMEIPKGYWFEIMPKSGLATKHNIAVHNGVIDNGYRGEIVVHMYNHGNEDYQVKAGDKIAQGVLRELIVFDLEQVEELTDSARGSSGFGSTGKR